MISKEKFVEYMSAIKKAEEKDRAFEATLCSLNSCGEGVSWIYADEVITMIKMVCDLMDVEYNADDIYGDDIQYFIYECDWGKNDHAIIEIDGIEIHLKTIEDLYDYIVKYNSAPSKTIEGLYDYVIDIYNKPE